MCITSASTATDDNTADRARGEDERSVARTRMASDGTDGRDRAAALDAAVADNMLSSSSWSMSSIEGTVRVGVGGLDTVHGSVTDELAMEDDEVVGVGDD
jgi:hypothetical protein